MPDLERREFLHLCGISAVALLAGCQQSVTHPTASTSPTASTVAEESGGYEFIVQNRRPKDLETPVEVFDSFLTPNERFFVRSHHPEPKIKDSDWKLTLSGGPKGELTFDLAALKKLEAHNVTAVLQCAGNSRSMFKPTLPGVQWGRGAVGNAEWRGARLADLLKLAGVEENSLKHFVFEGADKPLMDTVPVFAREIPLAKCLDPDTLLAYEMNGEPLPHLHGGPVRLVVPGWVGDDWLKWLISIQIQDQECQSFYYQKGYRYPTKPGKPGEPITGELMQPMTELVTRSLFSRPSQGEIVSKKDSIQLKGVAWTGGSKLVKKVEVSADGGRSWLAAQLQGEERPYSWRLWSLEWKPEQEGRRTLLCRATDSSGFTQAVEDSAWNPSGYLWNSADRLAIEVKA